MVISELFVRTLAVAVGEPPPAGIVNYISK
jgi:hypothetical protein